MGEDDKRLVDLEVKLAFTEERLAALDKVVAEQSDRLDAAEEELRLSREALRRLAAGMSESGEILGAYDGDDPVPRSG